MGTTASEDRHYHTGLKAVIALYNTNITYESLFPGLDGLARSLNVELEV